MCSFLVHRPDDVDPVVLLVEDGPLRARLGALGIQTWVAGGYDGRPRPAALARFTRSLLALLKRTEPDVVIAFGLKGAFMGAPACRIARVPIVWRKVDFSLDQTLARPLALAVDGVISVSDAVAEALGPLRAGKLLGVVGPPVRLDPDLRVVPNRDPLTIGTLATLTPIKGQAHIVEAAGLLSREFPGLRVLLAGSSTPDYPDYPETLERLAAEVGVGDRLELVGFVEDVGKTLGRLTVFVNATYRDGRGFGGEGLGGAILEAGWAGLPVVVTTGGGSSEGMRDGVTGTLVKPSDPSDLARGIAPYLRDHDLARGTGEAGRLFTREYFAPRMTAARLFEAARTIL
jgi:glycosyltransferase involved in cell wall biosynthesis